MLQQKRTQYVHNKSNGNDDEDDGDGAEFHGDVKP